MNIPQRVVLLLASLTFCALTCLFWEAGRVGIFITCLLICFACLYFAVGRNKRDSN
jgi:hypothetical protein